MTRNPLHLTAAQLDRASGVLLGTACGDALGAGYEFGPALPESVEVTMKGGGGFGWAPGEWTDDTAMALPTAEAAAAGLDLRDEVVQDGIVAKWVDWAKTAPDVGIQLSAILRRTQPTASAVRVIAREHHERNGRSAGNGSLMRTSPVALAYLDDPGALAEAARAISDLTHFEADAGDACVLWCLAIRHAVLTGELDVRCGLATLPADRAELWSGRLDEAEQNPPAHFDHNGWVVQALQGAWSAIVHTPVPELDPSHDSYPCSHLRLALEAAVRGGHDTDTVAAIAGGLLGARWGASAVPAGWRRIVHGRTGERARDLVRLASLIAHGGAPDGLGWPTASVVDYSGYGDTSMLAAHPDDPGVLLGGVGRFEHLPAGIDAVVSLCRVGAVSSAVAPGDHLEVRLIDSENAAANANLDFVLADTADAIATLRAEGKTVLVHCVQAISRTPTVGALYAARHLGVPAEVALERIRAVLPKADPTAPFRALLRPATDPRPEVVR
jgi:ADP-ribosyl-[dinitrogen reductase] hydrolase